MFISHEDTQNLNFMQDQVFGTHFNIYDEVFLRK